MQDKITIQPTITVSAIKTAIEQQEDLTISSLAVKHESFSGPLPPPAILKEYENLRRGSIELIFGMAQREQQLRIDTVHREEDQKDRLIAIAEKESAHDIKMQSRGQLIGACVLFCCVACAAAGAFYFKSPWPIIAAFLAVPTASLINTLINGKKPDEPKKEDK